MITCHFSLPDLKRVLVNTVSVACLFYPVSSTTFLKLVNNPSPFDAITDSSAPLKADLIFHPNGQASYGGFKRATVGDTSIPIFGHSMASTRTRVCIKQCWYKCKNTGERFVYDNHTQVVKLSSEINCLRWASALMELVYDFISETHLVTAPFEIPAMRYVKSALAVAENDDHDTYMVEEVIDEAVDGKFVKYIGNSSAIPNEFEDESTADRAAFLAFCQHVQYIKTQDMAFIGDFQGNVKGTSYCVSLSLIAVLSLFRWTVYTHRPSNYHVPVCIFIL